MQSFVSFYESWHPIFQALQGEIDRPLETEWIVIQASRYVHSVIAVAGLSLYWLPVAVTVPFALVLFLTAGSLFLLLSSLLDGGVVLRYIDLSFRCDAASNNLHSLPWLLSTQRAPLGNSKGLIYCLIY